MISSFFIVLRHTKQRIVHHDKHPVTGTVRFSFLPERVKKGDIVTMKMVQQSEFEFLIKLSFIYSVYTVFLE